MKPIRLILYHLRMPLVRPFETSFGRISTRDCLLVEIQAGGLVGWGECPADRDPGYSYETVGTAWHVTRDFLAPAILGREIAGAGELQRRMSSVRGHPMAKAGLEMAWWDLQGKAEGRSLRDLLGGARERVEVGVSVGLQEIAGGAGAYGAGLPGGRLYPRQDQDQARA